MLIMLLIDKLDSESPWIGGFSMIPTFAIFFIPPNPISLFPNG